MNSVPFVHRLRLVVRGVFALALGGAAHGASRPDLDAAAKRWFGGRPGGAAVAYVDADGVTFAAAGQFAPGDPRSITPDTTFEIGSVSKLFVALLLAESEKAGKVNRDDPAAKYLLPPGDPDAAKLSKITLVSLATHSAGLPRMASNFRSSDGNRTGFTRAQLMAGFRRDGATAVVGGKSVYSNFGVVLLGQALASAWGGGYPQVLQQQVLDPLGLEHTWLGLIGAKAPVDFPPALVKGARVPHWEFDALAPSGALRSTARDMGKFLQACLGQRETKVNASIRECTKPLRLMGDGPGKIGLNWMSTAGPQRPIYWHNGATAGFRAFVAFEPVAGVGVAVLTNTDTGAAPEALGFELMGRTNRSAPKK
ncbi:MAG: class A beta-lactamase-related serine hydrolase [Opitutus sp.]|nr:class A beta-lactamase-related serine hydrolase [Opitutus sp.]